MVYGRESPVTDQDDPGDARMEPSCGGLFDGFEGYVTPTDETLREVLTRGLVVLDANVLLNLYRYNQQARDDLLSAMERLGDSLWLPHQVLVEFWRNRERVLRDPKDTRETAAALERHVGNAVQALRAWANRVSLESAEVEQLIHELDGALDSVLKYVEGLAGDEHLDWLRDTNTDPVLGRLQRILNQRVGPPLSSHDYEEAVREGKRRIEAKQPPGYKDSKKESEQAVGDYLVWEQTLREAARQGADVLLVTGDAKEDWWRVENGERRGPRLELVAELRNRASATLFIVRPNSLLRLAQRILQVAVADQSVDDLEKVDQLLSDEEELGRTGGWNIHALAELLRRLRTEAPAQEKVILAAVESDGFVGREQVYSLAGYDPDTRQLRGFTRPVRRLAQQLREEGRTHPSAIDVLVTVYDDQMHGFGWADGFSIPEVLVPGIREAADRLNSDERGGP